MNVHPCILADLAVCQPFGSQSDGHHLGVAHQNFRRMVPCEFQTHSAHHKHAGHWTDEVQFRHWEAEVAKSAST